jgi:hypothetical protein
MNSCIKSLPLACLTRAGPFEMKRLLLAAVTCFALMVSANTYAMQFQYLQEGSDIAVTMSGEVLYGDDQRFRQFLQTVAAYGHIFAFYLDSPGGNVHASGEIADIIHQTGIATAVLHQCASSCFMMFAAGQHRYVLRGAFIGVHSAGVDEKEGPYSGNFTLAMARFSAAIGVPSSIVAKMVTTPPSGIYQLTTADLNELGVRWVDPTASSAVPPVQLPQVPHWTLGTDSLPAASQPPPSPEIPPMYQKGLADHTAWQGWVEQFSGEFRAGIEWWASQRSIPHAGTCDGSPEFRAGCEITKTRLAAYDKLRNVNADYKAGWNAYQH